MDSEKGEKSSSNAVVEGESTMSDIAIVSEKPRKSKKGLEEWEKRGGKQESFLSSLAMTKNIEKMDKRRRFLQRKSEAMKDDDEESDSSSSYDDEKDDENDPSLFGNVGKGEEDFYDPELDDKDARWMARQMARHAGSMGQKKKKEKKNGDSDDDDSSSEEEEEKDDKDQAMKEGDGKEAAGVAAAEKKSNNSSSKPFKSDAILSCPGCFSIVTIDCQQHVYYPNQFRAMFVQNCEVDYTHRMEIKGETDAVFRVSCSKCGADLGVIDSDEVYHFFQVLPSEV